MTRKRTRLLIRHPDGRYLDQGFDCADRWVVDPHDATPMTLYAHEDDTNEYKDRGCTLVEFEVSLTPTGRTCADLFKEEREAKERWRLEKAEEERTAAEAARLRDQEDARLLAATLGVGPLNMVKRTRSA